jgi:hypothetical protein
VPRRSFLALATAAGLAVAMGAGVAFREHTRNALTVTNGQYGEGVTIEVGPGGAIQLRQQRRGR